MKSVVRKLKHALEAIWKRRKVVRFFLGGSILILVIALALRKYPLILVITLALRKYPAWQVPAGIVGAGVFLVVLLWQFPKWQVSSVAGLEAKERFDRENEARKTLSQIVGGLVLLIGFYFTWQNLELTKRNQSEAEKATQENLRIASEGQITDRFTKAIAQLGDKKLEVRLGGIYALERIAKDSPKDHWPIMEVLTAYIRENAPIKAKLPNEKLTKEDQAPPKLAPDIQAILTVIGRRALRYGKGEDQRLDLHQADLRGADLSGAFLIEADLRRALLFGADLRGADVSEADLSGAYLSEAHLSGAHLGGAELSGAQLMGADLREADLAGAHLSGGAPRWGKGLIQSQLDSAYGDAQTDIPKGLQRPKHWR